MARHAAPASRTVPQKAYAAISEDVPPQIYEVAFYPEHLECQDLRHIPVMIIPDLKRRKRRKSGARNSPDVT